MTNLFLIGFMGCAKSSVAAYLAENYSMHVVEMDQVIQEKAGMSISDIFSTHGEPYFRDMESELIREIQTQTNQVISCGGGVVLRTENVDAMKRKGCIVWLSASPETIYERVKDDTARPLLKGNKNIAFIAEMMEQRREKYEGAAHIVVHTDGKTIDQIAKEIVAHIEG